MHTTQLKPRAIAVMCTLRVWSRSTTQLRNWIGDASIDDTRELLRDMRELKLVAMTPSGHWHLTYDGIGWCEASGLPVTATAKIAARQQFEQEMRL